MMLGMQDPVHDRVAQQHIRMSHIDFRTQHLFAVSELAVFHPFEQVEVLFRRPAAPRALLARHGHRTPALTNLLLRLIVHISQPFTDQFNGPSVQLVEIIGRIVHAGPLETEPTNVLLDRIDVLDILLNRVRIVETQVTLSSVFAG